MKFFQIAVLLLLPFCAFAQQPQSEEEIAKQMRENIEKLLERYEEVLELDDSQIFYADSILTHNTECKVEEVKKMQKSGVNSMDLYERVMDKWDEETYNAFRRILDDKQWEKYLKTGAGKAQKAREKKSAKSRK